MSEKPIEIITDAPRRPVRELALELGATLPVAGRIFRTHEGAFGAVAAVPGGAIGAVYGEERTVVGRTTGHRALERLASALMGARVVDPDAPRSFPFAIPSDWTAHQVGTQVELLAPGFPSVDGRLLIERAIRLRAPMPLADDARTFPIRPGLEGASRLSVAGGRVKESICLYDGAYVYPLRLECAAARFAALRPAVETLIHSVLPLGCPRKSEVTTITTALELWA